MPEIRRTTREVVAEFGPAVRAAREDAGLTGVALADRAGCSPVAVSEVERGVRAVSLGLARRLAAALGTTVDALCGDGKSSQKKYATRVVESTE